MTSAEPKAGPSGASEVAQRIREYDWNTTPLGPLETWPGALRTAVATALASRDATGDGGPPSMPLTMDAVNAFLVRFSDNVLELTDPQAIAQLACQLVADTLDVERAYWAEVDWTTREYVIGASVHTPGVPVIEGRFPIDAWEPFTAYHLAGRPVVVDDTRADERIPPEMRAAYAQIAVRADLATPVSTNGQLRCTLAVNQQRPRHWTEAEVALVRGVASRCWAAVERVRAEKTLRQSEERQVFLLHFSDALRACPDEQSIKEQAVTMLAAHLRLDRFWIAEVFEEEGIALVGPEHVRPNLTPMAGVYQLADYPEVMRQLTTQAIQVPSVADDPRFGDAEQALLAGLHIGALLSVALRKGAGHVTWAFPATMATPRQWTDDERVLLEEVAEQTWAAIERARAEAALRKSEARFRTFAEYATDTLWIVDAERGQLEYLSPAFERMWGESRDALMGDLDYWMDLVHPDDRASASQAMRRVVTGEVSHLVNEYRIVRPSDGAVRWIYDTGFAIQDTAGTVMRVGGIAQDITARKMAEIALRENEERLQKALSIATVGVLFFTVGGGITDTNEALARMTGYTREELCAMGDWRTLTPPEFREATEQAAGELASCGRTAPYEKQWIRKDGSRFWGLFAPTRLSGDGQQSACVEFIVDITERKLAEDALRESERRSRLILDRATDYAIFSTDRDRRIETWPPGAAAVFGWTAEEAVGQLMDITYMATDRAAGVPEQEFTQARETGHAPNVRWHVRKDGSYVFIEGDAYARRTEQGAFEGVFKIGQDISARLAADEARQEEEAARREELEVQVREATTELRMLSRRLLAVQEEERRRLALELHDEIGQVLTGLSFQLAAATNAHGGAITEAQATVQALTEQVRRLSLDLRPAVLDRYGLLAALEWHIGRFQATTGITVHLRHHGLDQRFPPEVEIAAFRVVQEALTNVARHSGADFATVQVHGDGAVTLVIRDTGSGFDLARGSISTGLGGMRERVKLLGGHLEIESMPGGGTTIIAELPSELPEEEAP